MTLVAALGIAFAADTVSITSMEIVDNAVIFVIPGAMEAGLEDAPFWGSPAFALQSRGEPPGPTPRHRDRGFALQRHVCETAGGAAGRAPRACDGGHLGGYARAGRGEDEQRRARRLQCVIASRA